MSRLFTKIIRNPYFHQQRIAAMQNHIDNDIFGCIARDNGNVIRSSNNDNNSNINAQQHHVYDLTLKSFVVATNNKTMNDIDNDYGSDDGKKEGNAMVGLQLIPKRKIASLLHHYFIQQHHHLYHDNHKSNTSAIDNNKHNNDVDNSSHNGRNESSYGINQRFKWKGLSLVYQQAIHQHPFVPFINNNINNNNDSSDIADGILKKEDDIDTLRMQWYSDIKSGFTKELNQLLALFHSIHANNNVNDTANNGSKKLLNSLREPISSICSHCLYSLLLLDLLPKETQVTILDFPRMIHEIIDDIGALAREKFGCVPEIEIIISEGMSGYVGLEHLIRFVLAELMKNAIFAMIDRYGALNIDDAPPIRIELTATTLTLIDSGNGISPDILNRLGQSLFTSAQRATNSYQYSRNHGVPFHGAGVGMLKSALYLNFHSASLVVSSTEGKGTTMMLDFGESYRIS